MTSSNDNDNDTDTTTTKPLKHTHHPDLQTLRIPFQVPNRYGCSTTITIEPSINPLQHGQGLLNLYPNPEITTLRYPILQASIISPLSQTYATLYGWVQITMAHDPDEPWVMDLYPPFQDVNSPFITWGACPTLVDAPNRDAQKVREYDWTARSFLCYSPDAAMSKTVVPVLAFQWGFWIEQGSVYVKELRRMDVSCWDGHLELFRGRFEGWEFCPAGKGGDGVDSGMGGLVDAVNETESNDKDEK